MPPTKRSCVFPVPYVYASILRPCTDKPITLYLYSGLASFVPTDSAGVGSGVLLLREIKNIPTPTPSVTTIRTTVMTRILKRNLIVRQIHHKLLCVILNNRHYPSLILPPPRIRWRRENNTDCGVVNLREPVRHIAGCFIEIKTLVRRVTGCLSVQIRDGARFRQYASVTA